MRLASLLSARLRRQKKLPPRRPAEYRVSQKDIAIADFPVPAIPESQKMWGVLGSDDHVDSWERIASRVPFMHALRVWDVNSAAATWRSLSSTGAASC